MDEFTAKKLGEVMAFCQVGLDTVTRGRKTLEEVLGSREVATIISEYEACSKKIEKISDTAGMSDITTDKAEATVLKLTNMRDLYVGGQWSNATEILEWHGFFEGAAIVHWELISGAGSGLGNDEIKNMAEQALVFHKAMLNEVSELLRGTGSARATQ